MPRNHNGTCPPSQTCALHRVASIFNLRIREKATDHLSSSQEEHPHRHLLDLDHPSAHARLLAALAVQRPARSGTFRLACEARKLAQLLRPLLTSAVRSEHLVPFLFFSCLVLSSTLRHFRSAWGGGWPGGSFCGGAGIWE